MIASLTRIVELVEQDLSVDLDVPSVARDLGTTEYHLRRMFSSLAAMPLSEYVRRRRMTVAAAELLSGDDDLVDIAVRFGYGSAEAFGRAFRAVHGVSPSRARREGGPFRSQPILRFHLTVEGKSPMHARVVPLPRLRLVGRAARVPLVHHGINPVIQEHIASLPPDEHSRLKALSDAQPGGLLQISADVDPDYAEGSELTYLHGVSVAEGTPLPRDLDEILVEAGDWAVFRAEGSYPDTLQTVWAATATDWFPAHPWRLRPGPSIVSVRERSEDFSRADCELWLPVERD